MINTELDIDYSDDHHGKYDCPMAQFMNQHFADLLPADDEYITENDGGWIRIGRRIYSWDDYGFKYCDTYNTVDKAQEVVRQAWVRIEEQQDEACAEQGCKYCRYCGRYDCGSCVANLSVSSGSSHVSGCDREWIG